MRAATAYRGRRATVALATVMAHVLALWLMINMRAAPPPDEDSLVNHVMLTVLEPPLPPNLSIGPVPIEVQLTNTIRLERLAPKTLGPPIEVPEPEVAAIAESLTATALNPADSNRGLSGTDSQSSGPSGGGDQIRLLQRIVPRYPASSVRRREQGITGVHVKVGQNGVVQDVKVRKTSGSRSLDAAALDAVRRWRFAPLPPGVAQNGLEFETELRFILYLFQFTLIGRGAADAVYQEQLKSGTPDEATPGSQEALQKFITEVGAGTYLGEVDRDSRVEIAKMRAALEEWGAVLSIKFVGVGGNTRWMTYRTGPPLMPTPATVQVSWNIFDIVHENSKSTWLIAVDRDGRVWDARASPVPW